jgi:hypothetical protein
VEREHRQSEEEAEGGPLGDVFWRGFFVIVGEDQLGPDKDVLLVEAELCVPVVDTKAYEHAGLEEAGA